MKSYNSWHQLTPASGSINILIDSGTQEGSVKGRVIIWRCYNKGKHCKWLMFGDIVEMDEMILSATWDMPFNLSITICKISGTSCWLLELKDKPWSLIIVFLKAHRKLEGSIELVFLFKRDMFKFTALDKGKILSCSEDSWE